MEIAETAGLDGVPLRVVGAAHLAVIALSGGRAKDFARVLALRESGSVTRGELELLATRHAAACRERRSLPNQAASRPPSPASSQATGPPAPEEA
jgi:hypothetical protein